MDISKISIKDGVVSVSYSTADGMQRKTLCDERNPPHAAFVDAMRLLMPPVAETLCLSPECADRMALKSLALSGSGADDNQTVKISVLFGVQMLEHPATIALPKIDCNDTQHDLVAAIGSVVREAESYIRAIDMKAV